MKKLHAHEVLDMMGTKTYTEELLKKEILEKFGEDTLFYTCSAEDMNADELIAFLKQKGKKGLKNYLMKITEKILLQLLTKILVYYVNYLIKRGIKLLSYQMM